MVLEKGKDRISENLEKSPWWKNRTELFSACTCEQHRAIPSAPPVGSSRTKKQAGDRSPKRIYEMGVVKLFAAQPQGQVICGDLSARILSTAIISSRPWSRAAHDVLLVAPCAVEKREQKTMLVLSVDSHKHWNSWSNNEWFRETLPVFVLGKRCVNLKLSHMKLTIIIHFLVVRFTWWKRTLSYKMVPLPSNCE